MSKVRKLDFKIRLFKSLWTFKFAYSSSIIILRYEQPLEFSYFDDCYFSRSEYLYLQ